MNTEMILKLAKKLRRLKHPKHYDQGNWIEVNECGTAACLAGHTVLMLGMKPAYALRFTPAFLPEKRLKKATPKTFQYTGQCFNAEGRLLDIEQTARVALGLTYAEGSALFDAAGAGWPFSFYERFRDARNAGKPTNIIAAELLEALAAGRERLELSEDDE